VTSDLAGSLRELYESLRTDMRERWDRDLPLEELLFDRWERARSLGFDDGASIYHNSYVFGDVRVGRNPWLGPFTLLDGTGGLTIGQGCSISSGVQIYSHDTVRWAVSEGAAPTERSPTAIGDFTYIGSQTVVDRGVTIADHCVIGASSFVNRDIPAYTVAAGVPCRAIGSVTIGADGAVELQYPARD
jgi:acetyltransferase-like isoleucine patch superfamily enzyme